MAKIKLTKDQDNAVHNRGGSLLVSAAAGSGKTKVLVERLFSFMLDERCNVDDFLIITYTKAAAAELRGKIAKELAERVAEDPGNAHLRKQMFRVYQADIKTVDAFCASLLRENVHLLKGDGINSLTPDFRVLDEPESQLMRERVLGRVLDEFYETMKPGDAGDQLVQTLGMGRDDRTLERLVLDLHSKIQSHAYPLQWLDFSRKTWAHLPDTLTDSDYGRVIMDDIVCLADYWAWQLERAVEEMKSSDAVYKAYGSQFLDTAKRLRSYRDARAEGWQAMSEVDPTFPRLSPVRGEENALAKEKAQAVRSEYTKQLKKIMSVFAQSEDEYLEDLEIMAPVMTALIDLTADFAKAYQTEKLRRNAMDFSDQEHFAIEILVDQDGHPSDLARQLSTRYREIMVDEYQDTNEVQNFIFDALSRNGENLFVVGDVKQSIYRFRLADPTIFLRKYLAYAPVDQAQDGQSRKVLLSRNFRSRQEVLQATNFVFRNIMSRDMGEMDYGADEELYFGAEYYLPRTDTDTEFHLINVENTEEKEIDRTETEARFIAARIRKMLDEKFPVQDGDGLRPIREEDIVILMRAPRARLKAFTEALKQVNVGCSTVENESLFDTVEISAIISLLQIIDNPRQDIPLISVLRSPLFGFTPDRLAQIRMIDPAGEYYDALKADTSEDSVQFCAELEELRSLSHDLTVDRLVWEIYSRFHFPAVFGSMEGGKQRKDNLTAFYAYAVQQAGMGKKSVFDFVSQIHDLMEGGSSPLLHTQTSSGGVQIMSIHKSKGLEFPVVFLCDLQKSFNRKDFNPAVLVHPDLGLGTERVDVDRRIHYKTISKMAVNSRMERESKAEEMRILYVAMTRAKEKLIIVDCIKKARSHIRNLIALSSLPVQPEAVRSVSCMGDWILLPLLNCCEMGEVHQWAGMRPTYLQDTGGGWDIHLWENPESQQTSGSQLEAEKVEDDLPDLSVLHQKYRFQEACTVPSKVTATQLKGRELDEEIAQGAVSAHLRHVSMDKPRFLRREKGLSASEKGTAMHLALQYLDFQAPPDEENVALQVEVFRQKRLLSDEQAQSVDCSKLSAFLMSPLAERIRQSSKVWREYPFALLLPATLYDPNMDQNEEMLLQGVVDCCFRTEEGIVIVDFKTDRIHPGEEEERAQVYRPQLDAYAKAISTVLEEPVCEEILYFLQTGESYTL